MADTFVVRELLSQLSEDSWRRSNPFSNEVQIAHAVAFHPFASDAERQEAMNLWIQRHQPCLFGRIGAAVNRLHFAFLDDDKLRDSDQQIAAHIEDGRRAWWQRSISPRDGLSTPAHGLVLAVISPRVSLAEPNQALFQFSRALVQLAGWSLTKEPQGEVFWEDLFLENPHDGTFVRFSFSVDFFAAAGDGRWWHDHRFPGGIAFTANSVGHMRRYREWYEDKTDQRGWITRTAMETIALAAETPYGRATWLRPLLDGKPFVREIRCPFEDSGRLNGLDWTRYAGHLHTDHSVRPEFFRQAPEKPPSAKGTEWVQDFQYLYDQTRSDHSRFSAGIAVSEQEVHERVGRFEDFVQIASPKPTRPRRGRDAAIADADRGLEVDRLMDQCRQWALRPHELLAIS